MALTQKAIDRRRIITDWAKRTIDQRDFRVLHAQGGQTPGGLLHQRLLMIVAQAGIPEVNDVHLLDNDDNWNVFRREMKFTAGYYFHHADVASTLVLNDDSWRPIMFSHRRSMERYFYRTEIVHSTGRVLLKPEAFHLPDVTGGFPNYSHFHSDPNMSYRDKVYEMLGLIGGKMPFSSDKSLKDVKFHFGPDAMDWAVDSESNRLNFYWPAQDVRLEVQLNDPHASVEYTNRIQPFLNDGTDLTFNIKVTAEDNSVQAYEWVLIDS